MKGYSFGVIIASVSLSLLCISRDNEEQLRDGPGTSTGGRHNWNHCCKESGSLAPRTKEVHHPSPLFFSNSHSLSSAKKSWVSLSLWSTSLVSQCSLSRPSGQELQSAEYLPHRVLDSFAQPTSWGALSSGTTLSRVTGSSCRSPCHSVATMITHPHVLQDRDGSDIFCHQTTIEMDGFRQLFQVCPHGRYVTPQKSQPRCEGERATALYVRGSGAKRGTNSDGTPESDSRRIAESKRPIYWAPCLNVDWIHLSDQGDIVEYETTETDRGPQTSAVYVKVSNAPEPGDDDEHH